MDARVPTDRAAEADLLRHADFLRRLSWSLMRDPSDAEDLAQDVALAALRRRRRPTNPGGWLRGTARNLARMTMRAGIRRRRREARVPPTATPPLDPADVVTAAEVHQRVAEAVRDLEEPYRTTVLHRYVYDLAPAEIARLTRTPVDTVRTRLSRALVRLRRRLDATCSGRRTWVRALAPLLPGPPPPGAASIGVSLMTSTHRALAVGGGFVLLLALLATGIPWPTARPSPEAPETRAIDPRGEAEERPPLLRGAAPESPPAARPMVIRDSRVGVRARGPGSRAPSPLPRRDDASGSSGVSSRVGEATDDPSTGDLRLRVVDERGEPRSGIRAQLLAKQEDGGFARTHDVLLDDRGEAVLEAVGPGRRILHLRHGNTIHHVDVDVQPGRVTRIDAVLPMGAVIVGQVLHAKKGALEGVMVRVRCGAPGHRISAWSETDARGGYRLEGLPRGTHLVRFAGRAIGFDSRPKARLVVEDDTGVVRRDFLLGRTALRGVVRDAQTGQPLPEVQVCVTRASTPVKTDAAGSYAYEDMPPGVCAVWFVKDGYALSVHDDIRIGADEPSTLDVDLVPGATLIFHLRSLTGATLPATGLARLEPVAGEPGASRSLRLAIDGTGVARGEYVQPGTYRITFVFDEHFARDVQVSVDPGESHVDVVCSTDAYDLGPSLRGVIREARTGEPIPGVRLWPRIREGPVVVTTDRGRFAFPNLRPGAYDMWVSKDGFGLVLLRDVEVKEGETAERDVGLHPAGTLRLHVTDAKGDPVTGRVLLSVDPEPGTEGTGRGTSVTLDPSGQAVYRKMVPGSYRLTLTAKGVGRGKARVDLGLGVTIVHVRLE